jgi:secreted trypsin-like serine protease
MESVNRSRPSVLQQVHLQFVPQTDPLCSALVSVGEYARLRQICAGFPPKAVCFGYSGGPLVRLIGHPNGKTY